MKFCEHDITLLIKECEELLYYVYDKEIDNDCSAAEQILINAVSNVMLALNVMVENKK